jgi:hypothetical protein
MPIPNSDVIIAIPIYKWEFEGLERFSIDWSLSVLPKRQFCFIAPEGMDISYYRQRYPHVGYEYFSATFFTSVENYSRLLLTRSFYERFATYEFLLVLQPDAILFRDDLDFWTGQPFDYIGAPWPEGREVEVNYDRFGGSHSHRIKAYVGNGGLSLRRVRKCLQLIDEFPASNETFIRTGSNEDYFFAILGSLSTDFVLPNQIIASRFAMELQPEHYYVANGKKFPMGAHAWATISPAFWAQCVPPLAAVLAP